MSKPLTTKLFIEKAIKVHNDKYDYSKVNYVNNKTKVCIICPEHGEFWQRPNDHLNGKECKLCSNESIRRALIYSKKIFVEKSNLLHGNKYIYDKFEYNGAKEKGCIICPIHGEFWQTACSHLQGEGCPKCAHEYVNSLKKQGFMGFKSKVEKIYGDRFILNEKTYIDSSTKMEIICRKHGSFRITPNNFLMGHKCPRCSDSKLESKISSALINENIEYIQNANSSMFKWLGKQHLDFYLPKYNVAIECQGGQHFHSVEYFGGDEDFLKRKELDERKLSLCTENSIKLFYFSDKKEPNEFLGHKVYKSENNLLNAIINGTK